MSRIRIWVRLALCGLLVSVIAIGIGARGCLGGGGHKGVATGSSWSSTISGMVFDQTSENTVVPLGGATVTAEWEASPAHTCQTKTNSDGTYRFDGINLNVPVTITITAEDSIQSTQTITTSQSSVNASAFLKGKGKKKGIIKKNEDTTLNTFDDASLPQCEITITAGAVASNISDVGLTPYHEMQNLPAPLPDGYMGLAGADFTAPSEVTFASGKEADCYIILPPSVKAEELSTADIKLMEFVNGNWVINIGKGKAFTEGPRLGYLGPDDTLPAQLKGVRPWCWAISQTLISRITGTVKNTSGSPIAGALVFARGTKTHTASNGTYTLNIAVHKDDSLVPVHAFASGYKHGHLFVRISPDETISDVDFILESRSAVAQVYGQVTNASNSNPIQWAIVTIQTGQGIRGMKYSDEGTPSDFTDDIFYVIPPPGVTITQYKWMLTSPSGSVFVSTIENGSSVVLHHLATEASSSATGAYKVELEVTYSGGKKVMVAGGFLLKEVVSVFYIADVQLPVSFQDQLTLKTLTDNQGNYRFINLPSDETLYASAKEDSFIASDTVEISALTPAEKRLQDFSLSALATDTDPPTSPSAFTGTAQSAFSILLTWSASTDNIGVDHYTVYRGGPPVEIGKTTGTSYIDSGLSPSTTYSYIIGAFDKANLSALSASIDVTTPSDVIDTEDPTTPTNLAAVAVSAGQIDLSWFASWDDVGVIGYKVYRGGSQIATTDVTDYVDTGLNADTTYEYKVAAYDAAGNPSDYSDVVNPTTLAAPDTETPSVPTALTATAVSSGQIDLLWEASTDNVGVDGYKVYRDDTYIDSVASTSYSDSGLEASTPYSYKVAAYDATGNTSGFSPSDSTSTFPAAGAGLVAYWKFDETSGTTAADSSGNGNNGSVYGATWGGGTLTFDGNDYVDCGNDATLNFDHSDSFTVEAWFNTTFNTHQRIVSKGMVWTNPAGFCIKVDPDRPHKVRVAVCDGMEAPSTWSTTDIDDGEWHHVALVRDTSAGKIYIYIDGVKENETTDTTSGSLSHTVSLRIGSHWNGYAVGEYFNGKIDEVKIYNYARSIFFTTEAIDNTSGANEATFRIDTNNKMHVAYTYDSGLFLTTLRYATNTSGIWQFADFENDQIVSISMVLNGENEPIISYVDNMNSGQDKLHLRIYDNGTWSVETIPYSSTTLVWTGFTSIDIDSVNNMHICYRNFTYDAGEEDDVAYLKYINGSVGAWNYREQIDTTGPPIPRVRDGHLVVDQSDKIHIAYCDERSGKLRYMNNIAGWTKTVVDNSSTFAFSSIALDQSDKVHIACYDTISDNLKYATNVTGTWTTHTIDSNGDVGQYASIDIDSLGNVHIAYYDATNMDLKYANNVTGVWAIQTIVSPGDVGRYSTLCIDNDTVYILFRDVTNDRLRIAKKQ